MAKRYAKKLLVIGWDAADWKVIWPLIREGKMPTLAKLINEGTWGNIATLDPPLSPMLWTSMATGKRPFDHGIHGFIEPAPDGNGVQPSTSTSRTVKAFWNMLTQKGMKSNVVAWWPSHPAEPINGVQVSNFYQNHKGPLNKPWPMMDGTVHPERLTDEMKRLRVHPEEMTQAHLLPFIPKAAEIDQEKDKRMEGVAKIIAHTSSVQAATTYLMENEEWDVTAAYFDGIDHFSHLCMKFHPPKMDIVPQDQFDLYKDVVSSGYRFHDMMLERQLELAGEDCNVILVSDHGFHPDHLRPKALPLEPAAPALEHSPYGIIVMKGNGLKSGGEQFFGASILDLTPTILTMMGLPIGEDMHGKVLTQAFKDKIEPETIPSWETHTEGEDPGRHDPDKIEDKWASAEAMEQLVALGYVDAPGEDKQKQVFEAKCESQYYIARSYVNAGMNKEAMEIFEQIVADRPDEHRYAHKLAHLYLQTKRYKKLRLLVEDLRKFFDTYDPADVDKELEEFVPNEKMPEDKKEEARKKKKEMVERKKHQRERDRIYVDFLQALHYMAINKPRNAMDYLKLVEQKAGNSPEVYLQMGKVCQVRQRWSDAEDAYIKALALDSTNAMAHHGLGVSYLRQNKLEEAADEFLTSIEILYFLPTSHYHLGETLYKMGKVDNALEAFNVAISMTPGMTKAHKWLAKIYDEKKMEDKAKEHHEFVANNIKGEIVIVSGLPRSGTSMMMQMLDKGGLDVLTDGQRTPDDNNPKGYYEFEGVKKMAVDKSWLPQAVGKSVKIIAQLLTHLPDKYNYKIIFMEREITEVLTSQQIMLGKEKHVEAKAFPVGLSETFRKQIEKVDAWIEGQPNIDIMKVNYGEVIENPEEQAENIASFLGQSMDVKAMAEVVDPELYRNKMASPENK